MVCARLKGKEISEEVTIPCNNKEHIQPPHISKAVSQIDVSWVKEGWGKSTRAGTKATTIIPPAVPALLVGVGMSVADRYIATVITYS